MLTAIEIKEQIATIESWHQRPTHNASESYLKERKADGKKLILLRQCVLYLETNPNVEFLKKQNRN